MSNNLKNHYKILDISENASLEEINAEFSKLQAEFIGGSQNEEDINFFRMAEESYREIIKFKILIPQFQAPFELNENLISNEVNSDSNESSSLLAFDSNVSTKDSQNGGLSDILEFFNARHPATEMNQLSETEPIPTYSMAPLSSENVVNNEPNNKDDKSLDDNSTRTGIETNLEIKNSKSRISKFQENRKKTTSQFVRKRKQVAKCPPIECEVSLTPKEILNGCTKSITVKRNMEIVGKKWEDETEFSLEIRPGIELNSRITYEQQGHRSFKALPGDVIFIINEITEQYFENEKVVQNELQNQIEDTNHEKQEIPIEIVKPHQEQVNHENQNELKNEIQENEQKVELKPESLANRHNLLLSMSDILKGCTKEWPIQRKRFGSDGQEYLDTKILFLNIKPGTSTGTVITVEREGDQIDKDTFVDAVFTVHDEPHPYFIRQGSDIKYVAKISKNFEIFSQIDIPTLENVPVKLKLNEEIVSKKEKRIFGRGLPYPTDTRTRGGLVVQFEIVNDQEAMEFAFATKNKESEETQGTFEDQNLFSESKNESAADEPCQLPPNEVKLMLTLEEIDRGCTKRTEITRKLIYTNRKATEEVAFLNVRVEPGSIEGTKIIIQEEGDREYDKTPANIIFTVYEENHSIFKRSGFDIKYTANITPPEAIVGGKLKIPTLNSGIIPWSFDGGITPKTVFPIENYGLPYLNEKNKRGRLLLHFNILWGKETQPSKAIERDLPLTLEQIFYGEIVKVDFERNLFERKDIKSVNVDVKPGTQTGSTFIFPREGNQEPGKIPADVVYIVSDLPHKIFKRNGANLEYTATITHSQLVNGGKINIPTLENETKSIFIDGIKEGSIKRISKCGLPYPDNPEKRGDILVRFEILPEPKEKDPDIESPLPLTLENILNGCKKRLNVNRRFYTKNREEKFENKVVEIEVKPGTEEGTSFRFNEYGDENLDSIPADIVFIARDKPHVNFKRNGPDIIHKALITRTEATRDNEIPIPTLQDGRFVMVQVKELQQFKNGKRYSGEGLPINNDPTTRGDLIIHYEIVNDDRKEYDSYHKIFISLTDVLYGKSMQQKISRTVVDLNGHEKQEEKTFSIDIKPGTETGERYIFPREGNRQPGYIPGDVVFIVNDEPNEIFKRDGSDIIHKALITRTEATRDNEILIPTLQDGRFVMVQVKELQQFKNGKRYPGEGLPKNNDLKVRGNLIVLYEIVNDNRKEYDSLYKIFISLTDVLYGKSMQQKISRTVVDLNGHEKQEEKTFSIDIKPGTETGERYIFSREGNRQPGYIPGDVVFIVNDEPNEIFKRDGSCIKFVAPILSSQASNCTKLDIPTLDGIPHSLHFEQIIKNTTRVIAGKGLPYYKNPTKRGDILVDVKIIEDKNNGKNPKINNSLIPEQYRKIQKKDENYQKQLLNNLDANLQTDSNESCSKCKDDNENGNPNQLNEQTVQNASKHSNVHEQLIVPPEIQDDPINIELKLSLMEIFNGTTRNENFQRKTVDQCGNESFENIKFELEIPPGVQNGTKFSFAKGGNKIQGKIPGDVIYEIKEIRHDDFKKNGLDLEYISIISYYESMAGFNRKIPTLKENIPFVPLNVKGGLKGRKVETIEGLGFADPDNPEKRGNLVVKFEIIDKPTVETTEQQSQPIEIILDLTLEEILNGYVEKFQHPIIEKRYNGKEEFINTTFDINIEPGTVDGERILFSSLYPGKLPNEIVFVVKEKPHDNFVRDGANIEYKAQITTKQLSSDICQIEIPTLENDTMPLSLNKCINSDTTIHISGRGLPFPDNINQRGDLLVRFNIIESVEEIEDSNKEQTEEKIEVHNEEIILHKNQQKEIFFDVKLEEIYKGCVKKKMISRMVINSKGKLKPKPKILTVNINPGTKTGEKYYFENEGDQCHNGNPKDIVLVLRDAKHSTFVRKGADILYQKTISSKQASDAAQGCTFNVPTLEKLPKLLTINERITHESSFTIEDRGLPYPDDSSRRGRIVVTFNIVDERARFNYIRK